VFGMEELDRTIQAEPHSDLAWIHRLNAGRGGYRLLPQRGVLGRVLPAADGSAAFPGVPGRGPGAVCLARGGADRVRAGQAARAEVAADGGGEGLRVAGAGKGAGGAQQLKGSAL
jgi:hypothetical protein